MTSPPAANSLTVPGANGNPTTFTLADDTLVILRAGEKKWPRIDTPVRNVVWAEVSDSVLEISFIARRRKKHALSLVHITGRIKDDQVQLATAFAISLLDAAYTGVKRHRRLRVFVNPKSGPGASVSHYLKRVEPIFQAARCVIETTFTQHPRHAQDLVRDLDVDQYDAVVTMSGDGLVHEVVNGFAEHALPERALSIPIAPIPTGSGNGLCINLLGVEDGYDVCAAALNAVKGQPLRIDLCSITQNDTRIYSFMSQVVGLFAIVDLGTEYLRFLGSTRFLVGYVIEVLKLKPCPVKLSVQVVESDKKRMVENLHAYQARARAKTSGATVPDADTSSLAAASTVVASPLPDSKATSAPASPLDDGWITFDKPMSYVYAGKGPYVSKDFMQFPVSLPDDGLVDVVAQEITTRKAMLDAMDGSENGDSYWLSTQHYWKARAYRVEPLTSKSCLSVDGEAYPFEPFQVECHREMATVLSPCGYYQAQFDLPQDSTSS